MAFSHYYFAKLGHKRRLKPDLCLIMVISTHTHTHKKMPKSRQRGKTKRNGTERKGNWVAMERKDAGLLGASETNDKHAKLLVQHTERKRGKPEIKVSDLI